MAQVSLRDPKQLNANQRLLVLFVLWNFKSRFPDQPVDKGRLSKAFAYAVSVVLLHGIDLEFHLSSNTRSFPVLDSILSEAYEYHLIRDAKRADESFIFKTDTLQSLMKLYPPEGLPYPDLIVLEEAAHQVILAYEGNVDLISHFHPINGNGVGFH